MFNTNNKKDEKKWFISWLLQDVYRPNIAVLTTDKNYFNTRRNKEVYSVNHLFVVIFSINNNKNLPVLAVTQVDIDLPLKDRVKAI